MLRALDLFCGAGGVSRGLMDAGFHVTGVDIVAQPRYCGDGFHQADAMTFPLDGYDFIHASPPCQGYSRLRHLPWLRDRTYPLLIDPMRERLAASGAVWSMENVEDAPLMNAFTLCGQMFGLPVYRHRKFEMNVLILTPPHARHTEVIGHGRMVNDRRRGTRVEGSSAGSWGQSRIVTVAGGQFKKADGERALGIDWMTKDELSQAIPPAYARFIGLSVLPLVQAPARSHP